MKFNSKFFIDSKGVKAVGWENALSCHWKDNFYIIISDHSIHLVDCSSPHKFWTKDENEVMSEAMWRHSGRWINPKEEIESADSFSYTNDIIGSLYDHALLHGTFREEQVTVYAPPEYVEPIWDFIRPKL